MPTLSLVLFWEQLKASNSTMRTKTLMFYHPHAAPSQAPFQKTPQTAYHLALRPSDACHHLVHPSHIFFRSILFHWGEALCWNLRTKTVYVLVHSICEGLLIRKSGSANVVRDG